MTDKPKASKSGRWQFSLRGLVIVHVVASLVGCVSAATVSAGDVYTLARVFTVSLLYGQACLLGVWLAMGTCGSRWRMAGTLGGIAYLSIIWAFHTWSVSPAMPLYVAPILPTMFTVPIIGIATILLVVRRWKAQLVVPGIDFPVQAIKRLQFSIRHLFFLTAAVAVLIMIAQRASVLLANDVSFWPRQAKMICEYSLGFGSTALAAVWAVLGFGRPTERIPVVLLLAVFTGTLIAYIEFPGWAYISFWAIGGEPIQQVLAAVVVATSLLVVRSNGYRLVRRSPRVTPIKMVLN